MVLKSVILFNIHKFETWAVEIPIPPGISASGELGNICEVSSWKSLSASRCLG